jgi:hypothetical protein
MRVRLRVSLRPIGQAVVVDVTGDVDEDVVIVVVCGDTDVYVAEVDVTCVVGVVGGDGADDGR